MAAEWTGRQCATANCTTIDCSCYNTALGLIWIWIYEQQSSWQPPDNDIKLPCWCSTNHCIYWWVVPMLRLWEGHQQTWIHQWRNALALLPHTDYWWCRSAYWELTLKPSCISIPIAEWFCCDRNLLQNATVEGYLDVVGCSTVYWLQYRFATAYCWLML